MVATRRTLAATLPVDKKKNQQDPDSDCDSDDNSDFDSSAAESNSSSSMEDSEDEFRPSEGENVKNRKRKTPATRRTRANNEMNLNQPSTSTAPPDESENSDSEENFAAPPRKKRGRGRPRVKNPKIQKEGKEPKNEEDLTPEEIRKQERRKERIEYCQKIYLDRRDNDKVNGPYLAWQEIEQIAEKYECSYDNVQRWFTKKIRKDKKKKGYDFSMFEGKREKKPVINRKKVVNRKKPAPPELSDEKKILREYYDRKMETDLGPYFNEEEIKEMAEEIKKHPSFVSEVFRVWRTSERRKNREKFKKFEENKKQLPKPAPDPETLAKRKERTRMMKNERYKRKKHPELYQNEEEEEKEETDEEQLTKEERDYRRRVLRTKERRKENYYKKPEIYNKYVPVEKKPPKTEEERLERFRINSKKYNQSQKALVLEYEKYMEDPEKFNEVEPAKLEKMKKAWETRERRREKARKGVQEKEKAPRAKKAQTAPAPSTSSEGVVGPSEEVGHNSEDEDYEEEFDEELQNHQHSTLFDNDDDVDEPEVRGDESNQNPSEQLEEDVYYDFEQPERQQNSKFDHQAPSSRHVLQVPSSSFSVKQEPMEVEESLFEEAPESGSLEDDVIKVENADESEEYTGTGPLAALHNFYNKSYNPSEKHLQLLAEQAGLDVEECRLWLCCRKTLDFLYPPFHQKTALFLEKWFWKKKETSETVKKTREDDIHFREVLKEDVAKEVDRWFGRRKWEDGLFPKSNFHGPKDYIFRTTNKKIHAIQEHIKIHFFKRNQLFLDEADVEEMRKKFRWTSEETNRWFQNLKFTEEMKAALHQKHGSQYEESDAARKAIFEKNYLMKKMKDPSSDFLKLQATFKNLLDQGFYDKTQLREEFMKRTLKEPISGYFINQFFEDSCRIVSIQ